VDCLPSGSYVGADCLRARQGFLVVAPLRETEEEGGARRAASEMGIPFLGEVPLDIPIRSQGDLGEPIVSSHPDAASSVVLRQISEQLAAQVSIRNYNAPVLEIE